MLQKSQSKTIKTIHDSITTAGVIGSAYGGVIGGIYGQNLAAWSGQTSSFMQNATLWVTKTGSISGGKQVGTSFGNGTALGGSIDPLFDSATNPWWGAKNTWNLMKGEK
ncbi:hypothetical protein [Collimonas sp.]|uniref:hypothetical protein n=1 Tax=Collimonas sp. TaxID=1963772 RepID=UPI002CF4F689|nr:hypothetical protein [Collimonas sp.]HWW06825.1 hypothetical protein [Collimonas sp.]